MKLLRIEIEEFGKLANVCYELEDGINLFEGANESGKSTLLAFIRFIFYGFPRKGGAEGEEREKRLSWQGHRAAGKLYLQTERGEFCIQRSVVRQGSAARESFSEQLSMISLAEGREVALDGKTPGEYLMGLSPTLYDSTLCLRQSDAARVSSADVGEAVGEMLFSGSSGVGADAALEQLRAARRELLHQKGRGGRIADLEDAIAQGQVALVRAIEDTQKLQELKQNALRCRFALKTVHHLSSKPLSSVGKFNRHVCDLGILEQHRFERIADDLSILLCKHAEKEIGGKGVRKHAHIPRVGKTLLFQRGNIRDILRRPFAVDHISPPAFF